MFKITETMKSYDYFEVAEIINGRCIRCNCGWKWPQVDRVYTDLDGRSVYEIKRAGEAYVLIKKEVVR